MVNGLGSWQESLSCEAPSQLKLWVRHPQLRLQHLQQGDLRLTIQRYRLM